MTDTAKATIPITERRCKNCACILEVPTQLINQKAWICRLGQPFIVEKRERAHDGSMVTSANFSYKQTTPDFVCFEGWRPEGTLPGENYKINQLLPMLAATLQQANIKPLSGKELKKFMTELGIDPPIAPQIKTGEDSGSV